MAADTKLDLSEQTIVLVDDVSFNREIIRQLFRGLGNPTVHEAGDGHQAIDALIQLGDNVDFVVADFNMPNMHGLELLKAVRLGEHGIDRSTPVAMLTAHSDVGLVESALSLDVNAFLVKPVSKDMLEKRITAMLQQVKSGAWVKPRAEYRKVDVSSATIREVQNRPVSDASVQYFASIPAGSPAAEKVNLSIKKLLSESGEAVAARVLSKVDTLVSSGTLKVEMIPRVLEVIDVKARARGERLTVPEPDRGQKPSGVTVSVAEPDRSGPSAKDLAKVIAGAETLGEKMGGDSMTQWTTDADQLAKAMEEIKNGASLNVDVFMKDGQLFIEAGTPMTPRIFSIVVNLDDLELIRHLPGLEELLSGVKNNEILPDNRPAREVEHHEIREGHVVARNIYTADGRIYIHQGQELNAKFINMLNVAKDLGHIEDTIWVHHD